MLSAMGRRSPADERRGAPTRSAAFAMSLLAHAAAMGALLMLKPTPPLATPPEVIEVTVVLEEALTSPQANNLSVAIPRDASVDAPVAPLVSLMNPDVIPTASSSDWFQGVKSGWSVDVAGHPAFGPQTHVPAFDTLATMLDCLAVGGSTRGTSGRPRRAHPPCASDDPPFRAPAMTLLLTYASRPSETGADNDCRTFKPSQSVFYESPLPDQVPQANRAFENRIIEGNSR